MITRKQIRCAIYTRKSTEEGLDQSFNSLDAQREACEAFIASQKHEGWKTIRRHYDDGGISGGHMERPALCRLVDDIRSGSVDRVIVYKIDRLTRSLSDFARLVETFDQHECSFVSVTQAFNTSTSMGRLTLNVLLSFAQFEREVTAERIRDKIAASKKKGMWMGGLVPLGYDVEQIEGGRRLITNEGEAATVMRLFELLKETGNLGDAAKRAKTEGHVSKRRHRNDGSLTFGGKPLSRGQLHYLLRNPIYTGKIRHKDQVFNGLHEPLISDELFEDVGMILDANRQGGTREIGAQKKDFPLAGKITDETESHLSTTWTKSKGRVHRYYVSRPSKDQRPRRINAAKLETAIEAAMQQRLNELEDRFATSLMPADIEDRTSQITRESPMDWADLIETVQWKNDTFIAILDGSKVKTENGMIPHGAALEIEMPFTVAGRQGEKLVLGSSSASANPNFKKSLYKAIQWRRALCEGQSVSSIASSEGVTDGIIRSRVQLAHLAPDIQRAILRDQLPATLTLEDIVRTDVPVCWTQQRKQFGFSS